MPKSTACSMSGAATNRLPSCRSAWKTPWSSAWLRKPRVRWLASAGRSSPGRSSASGRDRGVASTQSRVSTRLETASHTTLGARMWSVSAITSPSSLAAAASRRRSSSSSSERATVAAKARGSSRRSGGAQRSARTAPRPRAPTSADTRASIPGRSTFTATLRPPTRVAGWAWAREAAATGAPNVSNRLSSGRSSPASTCALATSRGKGGRRSFSRDRSSANTVPKMSARVDRSWPSLIAAGPSRSNARASRSPGRPGAAAPPAGCAAPPPRTAPARAAGARPPAGPGRRGAPGSGRPASRRRADAAREGKG